MPANVELSQPSSMVTGYDGGHVYSYFFLQSDPCRVRFTRGDCPVGLIVDNPDRKPFKASSRPPVKYDYRKPSEWGTAPTKRRKGESDDPSNRPKPVFVWEAGKIRLFRSMSEARGIVGFELSSNSYHSIKKHGFCRDGNGELYIWHEELGKIPDCVPFPRFFVQGSS